jgi:hypothetical protein
MHMTTIRVPVAVRDRLAAIAASDYGGATLPQTLERLMIEHRERAILEAYTRLRDDDAAWSDYTDELCAGDRVSAETVRRDEGRR